MCLVMLRLGPHSPVLLLLEAWFKTAGNQGGCPVALWGIERIIVSKLFSQSQELYHTCVTLGYSANK